MLTINIRDTNIKLVHKRPFIRAEGWDPINWFNPAPFVFLSQASTFISNTICHGLFFCVQLFGRRVVVCFVDIVESFSHDSVFNFYDGVQLLIVG